MRGRCSKRKPYGRPKRHGDRSVHTCARVCMQVCALRSCTRASSWHMCVFPQWASSACMSTAWPQALFLLFIHTSPCAGSRCYHLTARTPFPRPRRIVAGTFSRPMPQFMGATHRTLQSKVPKCTMMLAMRFCPHASCHSAGRCLNLCAHPLVANSKDRHGESVNNNILYSPCTIVALVVNSTTARMLPYDLCRFTSITILQLFLQQTHFSCDHTAGALAHFITPFLTT